MLLFLHSNLGALAALTAVGNPRYAATGGVLIRDQGNGLYSAQSTDGRRLLIVQGPILDAPPGADVEDVDSVADVAGDNIACAGDIAPDEVAVRAGHRKRAVNLYAVVSVPGG